MDGRPRSNEDALADPERFGVDVVPVQALIAEYLRRGLPVPAHLERDTVTYEINGQDVLSYFELSRLCAAHVKLGLQTDALGALFLNESYDAPVLRAELEAIRPHVAHEDKEAVDVALRALDAPT